MHLPRLILIGCCIKSLYSSTSLPGVMMMKKCTEQWNLYKFNDLLAYSKFNRLKLFFLLMECCNFRIYPHFTRVKELWHFLRFCFCFYSVDNKEHLPNWNEDLKLATQYNTQIYTRGTRNYTKHIGIGHVTSDSLQAVSAYNRLLLHLHNISCAPHLTHCSWFFPRFISDELCEV